MRSNSNRGNTLVLVVVAVFAMLVVAYIVINYSQLLATHKEAQTAIDAASLAAAKDMSHIIIDEKDGCHFGVVGLVDDAPRLKDKRPVLGINTLMGTIRLDAVIANRLGNSTMLVFAAHDLQRLQADCLTLRKKIVKAMQDKSFVDKDGNKIDLLADANGTYDENAIKFGNSKRVGDVKLSAGWYTSPQGLTSIPVISPNTLAQVDNTNSATAGTTTVYKAMVDVPVTFSANGSQGKFVFKFIPVGDAISLASSSECEFPDPAKVNTWPGYLPPYLIKAEVDQEVNPASPIPKDRPQSSLFISPAFAGEHNCPKSGSSSTTAAPTSSTPTPPASPTPTTNTEQALKMKAVAVSICGGMRQTFGSGLLQVALPGGPPPRGEGPDCTSVQTIMNATQIKLTSVPNEINNQNRTVIDPDRLGTASTYTPVWNKEDLGQWFIAAGGPVPVANAATLPQSHFRLRGTDDPSVVLACCVYDWLHAMYLRPNADQVINKLAENLNLYSATQTGACLPGRQDGFIPAAYADSTPKYPVTFGLFDVPVDGVGDPRDLRNFEENPAGYRRQLPNVFGYVPADMTLPDQSLVVAMDGNSNVVTTNGQPPSTLTDFFEAIARTDTVGAETFKTAQKVLKKKLHEAKILETEMNAAKRAGNDALAELKKAELYHALQKAERAAAAERNSYYIVMSALAMLNDRKALSGLGLTKINENKFEMIGGYFLPPNEAATEAALLGDSPVSTGQDSLAPVRDWCALLKDQKIQLDIFQPIHQATSINTPDQGFLAPVFAASAQPQALQNIFTFKVTGDVTGSNAPLGVVVSTRGNSTLCGVNVIRDQLLYQNTASLVTSSKQVTVELIWNCIARDNGANYGGSTAYYGNPSDPGYNLISSSGDNPPLVAEWSLRCPAPRSKCKNTKAVQMPVGGGLNEAIVSSQIIDKGTWTGNYQLSRITPVADAAGNISYYLNATAATSGNSAQQLHFFGDEASWVANMQKANAEGRFYGAYTFGATRGTQNLSDGATWKADLFASPQSLSDWYNNGKDPIGSDSTPGFTVAEKTAMRASIYSNLVFYTIDQSYCAHLYAWAS
jgi:hypothetical protein